jgi:hypothetical protein
MHDIILVLRILIRSELLDIVTVQKLAHAVVSNSRQDTVSGGIQKEKTGITSRLDMCNCASQGIY